MLIGNLVLLLTILLFEYNTIIIAINNIIIKNLYIKERRKK